jgi:hypothetical protein
MAVAFAQIEGATKSATGQVGQQKYKYSDLTSVIEAIKPALVANGLFFTQHPEPHDRGVQIETILHHAGGESVSLGKLFVPANKADAQGFGSALTYARRYALVTAFGVPVEDDDGNAAAKSQRETPQPEPAKKEPAHSALKAKVRSFVHELNGCGDSDELNAFLATADALAIVREVKEKLPAWWDGWDEQPDGFTPLGELITRRQHECAQATANYMTA